MRTTCWLDVALGWGVIEGFRVGLGVWMVSVGAIMAVSVGLEICVCVGGTRVATGAAALVWQAPRKNGMSNNTDKERRRRLT